MKKNIISILIIVLMISSCSVLFESDTNVDSRFNGWWRDDNSSCGVSNPYCGYRFDGDGKYTLEYLQNGGDRNLKKNWKIRNYAGCISYAENGRFKGCGQDVEEVSYEFITNDYLKLDDSYYIRLK